MVNENQELQYQGRNFPGILLGVLVGGLAGALTMLVLAPRSGKDMRRQIQKKSIKLRAHTSGVVKDAVGQMRSSGNRLTKDARHKAKDFLHNGQSLVAQQLDHVSGAALAGKKAIQNT